MGTPHRAFEFLYLLSEIIVIVLFLTVTEYSTSTQGKDFFTENVVEERAAAYEEIADEFIASLPT